MEASDFQHPQFKPLLDTGLNLHCVLDLAALPTKISSQLAALTPDFAAMRQVIIIGHGGPGLWDAVTDGRAVGEIDGADPIDTNSRQSVADFFHGYQFHCLYPGDAAVNLQWFGEYAGWHHTTPFRIGINAAFGTWFAYRALVIANTRFALSKKSATQHPCTGCTTKACMAACPVARPGADAIDLNDCLGYRLSENSPCAQTCLAREACPVAPRQRYSTAQLAYHYNESLIYLKRHRRNNSPAPPGKAR